MNKDTNMLFNPAMVRGLLNGRKTMTRRLFSDKLCITEKPEHYKLITVGKGYDYDFPINRKGKDDRTYAGFQIVGGQPLITEWLEPIEVPYAEVGDRIYVRETHYRYGKWVFATHNSKGVPGWVFVPWNDQVMFEDNPPEVVGKERAATMSQWWKRPSLFMLKGHTRIILECTEKKVERLLDITEADALREGVEVLTTNDIEGTIYRNYMWHGNEAVNKAMAASWPYQLPYYNNARDSFFSLWASINGVESYQQNPWLVAVGFKRVL